MNENHDCDGVFIRDRCYQHAVLRRDWVCSTCGGRLVTKWYDESPNWRTVCYKDEHHDPNGFVHKHTWAYLQDKELREAAQAQDVFSHLPEELQDAILATK